MPTPLPPIRVVGRLAALTSLALCLLLAACGEDEDEDVDPTTGRGDSTVVTGNLGDASPAASQAARSNLPQDAETATVSIKDGKLDPDTIEGQTGLPFILVVNGDGTEHTLTIDPLVTGWKINAQGQTEVTFTVGDDTDGQLPILLDGEEAGTFTAQAPGGVID